ncbi:hypothetical protein HYV84_06130, partial [Candidatus Woesearchaeota archaeon]|nr:hypothetical protein [Candidatus Woesearchaeota archaeon]
MHELQATFIENKLFLWGISSNPDEVFTPLDKLEKIYDELFLSKVASKKTYRIEMPAAGDALVVPPSMKLSFNQFDVKKAALKIFSVGGIEISSKALIQNFVHPERRHGFLFGDSFMFFENFLRFAFSLVSRQRFVPYFIGNQSCFLPNLDNPDDYEAFQDFCNIAPLSIKPAMEHGISDILSQCLGYFINVIIEESLNSLNLSIRNETKTDEWLLGLIGKKGKIDSTIGDELTKWGASRRIDRNTEYQMLFRLEEPSDGSNNWQIAYCMQS